MLFCFFCCLFFQAEDGIRDLVRSRGLGDVYKRQDFLIDFFIREIRKIHNKARSDLKKFQEGSTQESEDLICMLRDVSMEAVSYTHLTLPTSDLV